MAKEKLIDAVVKKVKIVTAEGIITGAGIGIDKEKIVALAQEAELPPAKKVIDAQGNYIMPGVLDPHTHPGVYRPFDQDIASETKSAAAGGVTSMLGIIKVTRMGKKFKEISEPKDVVPFGKAFPLARKIVDELATVDVGFTLAVQNDQHAAEIPQFARASGVTSYKFYLGYKDATKWTAMIGLPTNWDDGTLYYGMESIVKIGGVACFHAENNMITRVLTERVVKSGKRNLAAWEDRSPDFVEAYDINRVAYLSRLLGTRIYPVHVSSGMGLDECKRAKDAGTDLVAETCPHYLLVSKFSDPPGELAKVNPPVRDKKNHEALWKGVQDGDIDCIGSDHVSCYRKKIYVKGDIWKSKAGSPSVAIILPLMLSEGVNKGRISFPRLVEIMCTNTAKTFGLYPKKGAIQVGSDADLVVVDLKKEDRVSYRKLHSDSDVSIYEGKLVKGWPILTMLRGEIVYKDGKIIGEPRGKYLPRKVGA